MHPWLSVWWYLTRGFSSCFSVNLLLQFICAALFHIYTVKNNHSPRSRFKIGTKFDYFGHNAYRKCTRSTVVRQTDPTTSSAPRTRVLFLFQFRGTHLLSTFILGATSVRLFCA
jgi:hypothetical protein